MNFKVIFKCMLLAGLPFLAACNSDDTDLQMVQPLQLCVSTGVSESRAVVDGWFLPEGGQLGVSLVAADGSAYDGKSYNNIPYTATGNGYDIPQTWSCTGSVVPSLSTTLGKAVAYYPYNESVTDLTAIPIETASQTDYMYSGWYSYLYYATPKANLTMNHAMAVIKVVLPFDVIGDFTNVTQITLESDMFGTDGILNATDGSISSVNGKNTQLNFKHETGLNIYSTADGLVAEILVVPDVSVVSGYVNVQVLLKDSEGYSDSYAIEYYPNHALMSGKKYTCRIYDNGGGIS